MKNKKVIITMAVTISVLLILGIVISVFNISRMNIVKVAKNNDITTENINVEDNTTTKAVDVTISGNKISAELNLHAKVGAEKENAITLEADGAYVPDLSDDLTALQTLVGNKADSSTSTSASGLCKDIDDINKEIGNKAADAVMDPDGITIITPAVPATGIYKYIDDKTSDISGNLTYATTEDINTLFS